MKPFSLGLTCGTFLGLLLGILLGIYLLPAFQRLLPSQSINIQGIVKYSPAPDLSLSGTPPEGYYIEAQTSFYLDHIDPQFRDKSVLVSGPLSIICGHDGYPCFPQLQVRDVQEIKNK